MKIKMESMNKDLRRDVDVLKRLQIEQVLMFYHLKIRRYLNTVHI